MWPSKTSDALFNETYGGQMITLGIILLIIGIIVKSVHVFCSWSELCCWSSGWFLLPLARWDALWAAAGTISERHGPT